MEASSIVETQLGLPEDLRDLIDQPRLVKLVFEALHVGDLGAPRSLPGRVLPLGTPRILLTLLTYSYAIGLYSSEEIERQILKDPQFRYLAAKSCPSGNDLRRFRRLNRDLVRHSLGCTLAAAWDLAINSADRAFPDDSDLQEHPRDGFSALFESAAELRINRAAFADTMALDD